MGTLQPSDKSPFYPVAIVILIAGMVLVGGVLLSEAVAPALESATAAATPLATAVAALVSPTATLTSPPPTTLPPSPSFTVTTTVTATVTATATLISTDPQIVATLDPTQAALQALVTAHAASVANMTDGKQIYELRCAPCHGLNGEGVIGPSFRDRPLLTPEFVLRRVRTGGDVMSSFTPEELPDDMVTRVTDYLQTEIVGKDLAVLSAAELEEGRALYREYCTECHAVFGQGKDNLGPAINAWPPYSITRIVEGGLLPLPNMPRLQVTPAELRLIAYYVQSMATR